jgi:hypothetical protein
MFVYCQCHPPGILLNVDTGQSIKKKDSPGPPDMGLGTRPTTSLWKTIYVKKPTERQSTETMKWLFRTVSYILLLRKCSVYLGQKLKFRIREMKHF